MLILCSAKTLILSESSTFSQMGALLADTDANVHVPLHTLQYPRVTLSVPEWKYHLVDLDTGMVVDFDVAHDRLQVRQA